MPRDNRVTAVDEVWASSTQANANLDVRPGETPLVFEDGYEEEYSRDGGHKVARPQFNWFFRLLTAVVNEVNKGGLLLEWDSGIAYTAVARVVGSDGNEYKAVQASTNQDPTADTTNTYWQRMIPDAVTTPTATTARQGTVEYASAAEVSAGTRTDRVASLANIIAMIQSQTSGRLLPGTNGTMGQFLSHDGTYQDLPAGAKPASQTEAGVVEYASPTEVSAATATDRVPSIADVATMIAAQVAGRLLPAADGTAGQFLGHDGTYRALPTILHPAAREDFVGTVELATQAEAESGNATQVPNVIRVAQMIAALVPTSQRLPAAGTAGQYLAHNGAYADLPAASATAAGVTEYASVTEVEAAAADKSVSPSVLPIKKVVTYTASEEIVAANVAGTLHLRAG